MPEDNISRWGVNSKGCPYRPCCLMVKIEHPTKGLICTHYGAGCCVYIGAAEVKELNLKEGYNTNA